MNRINNLIIIAITLPFFFFAYNMNVISRDINLTIICHFYIVSRITGLFDPLKKIYIYNNLINE